MRKSLIPIALLIVGRVLFAVPSVGSPLIFSRSPSLRQPPDPESSPLTATFEILGQTYCHVDDESFAVKMDVRLHLRNASSENLILSRRIDSPDVVRVAKSVEAGEAGQFESALNPDTFLIDKPQDPKISDSPSADYFVVLSPGERYEFKSSAFVQGTRQPTSRQQLVSRGEHVLQLGISTWPYYGYSDVQGLKTRWAKFGDLVVGTVYTDFIPFHIPDRFKAPPCRIPLRGQKSNEH